jgi:tetratricopeptide (TPR) repeat protein
MLDWSIFGGNASGHHFVSMLLHIGAVILLFLYLNKTTDNIWPAAFAAAFVALHPLRVESIAWAAIRKDVLSMFLGMACLYAYAFYVEKNKISYYLLCLILFILTLMSKASMLTLPFVFLLMDYWPTKRWQKALSAPVGNRFQKAGNLICEKVPFILLAVASMIVAVWAQNKEDGLVKLEALPFAERLSHSLLSYTAYLEKIFWPVNLMVYYPYDCLSISGWKILLSVIILALITIAVLYYFKKKPFLSVGWFWYLGTLFPLIGLLQASSQAIADRYTYFPSIGIAIIIAWGMPSLVAKTTISKIILRSVGIIFLTVIALLSWSQCRYWKSPFELWNHVLEVTENNYLAYENRGIAYGQIGQYQLAIADFSKAINLYHYYKGYNNRGFAYANLGLYQNAIEDYDEAIRLKPDYAIAYQNRGFAYFSQNKSELGCRDAQIACTLGYCKLLDVAREKSLCH